MTDENAKTTDTFRPDELIGQKLEGYEVVARIGEGGMGVVYGGIHPTIRKKVAIKVLKPEFARDKEQVMRLTQEAQAVNSIGHHHIIDIFGQGELPDGRHYILMEYLEGQSLETYLKQQGRLPWDEAAQLLIEICRPLQAAHQAGVIHRDLKPSNVFLVQQRDGGRYLKLLDFGLAKVTTSAFTSAAQSNLLQVSGTPSYMAPEQARAQPVSAATDLYALGIMAYELVAGRVPFVEKAPMDVIMAHVTRLAAPVTSLVPELPPEFAALIHQLISKEPRQRPENAEEVRRRLDTLVGNVVTDPGSRSMAPVVAAVAEPNPFAQTVRSNPAVAVVRPPPRLWLISAAAAGAVLLLGLGGAAWWFSHPAPVTSVIVAPPAPLPIAAPEPTVTAVEVRPPVAPEVAPQPVEPAPPEPSPPQPAVKPVEPGATPRVAAVKGTALTPALLVQRIDTLEKRLQASAGDGEEPDSSAAALLKKYRFNALSAKSPRQLAELKTSLDKFEARFLKGR